jgi:hypothetical protein
MPQVPSVTTTTLSCNKIHIVHPRILALPKHGLDIRIAFDGDLVVVRVYPFQDGRIGNHSRFGAQADLFDYFLIQG